MKQQNVLFLFFSRLHTACYACSALVNVSFNRMMYHNGNTGYPTNGVPPAFPTSQVVLVTQPMHVMPPTAPLPGLAPYPMQPVPSMFAPQLNYTTYPTQQQQQQQPMSYVLLPRPGALGVPPAMNQMNGMNQFHPMPPQYVVNMNVSNNVYHPPPPLLPPLSSPSVPAPGLSSLYITRSAIALSLCVPSTNRPTPRYHVQNAPYSMIGRL